MKDSLKHAALVLLMITATSSHAGSIEQFHEDYYTQICTAFIACSDNVALAEQLQWLKITNVTACVSVISEGKEAETWREVLTGKTASFNASASQACLAAAADLSCEAIEGIGRNIHKPSFVKGCEDVIVGVVETSKKCNSGLECKSNDAGCYDTCMVPLKFEACGENSCSAGKEFCDHEKLQCSAYKNIGETCLNSFECKDECNDGFCKAPLPVVKPGGQCGKGFGNFCSIGEFCAKDHCTPFGKKTESCSDEGKDYKPCEAPLACQDNICAEVVGNTVR